jgi:hypothetical protein
MVPLIVHWDGESWSRVKGPGIPVSGKLLGVSMVSATDGWAVGVNPFKGNHILLHWDGTSWAPVPGPAGGKGALLGVSADSAADAWTAGPRSLVRGGPAPAWHWDGTDWTQVPITFSGEFADQNAVSAASGAGRWAHGARQQQEGEAATVPVLTYVLGMSTPPAGTMSPPR